MSHMYTIEYPPNHIFEVFSIDWEWNQEHKTISNFPKEVMDIVMKYLPKKSILALMSTCRDLHRTCISYLFQNHKMRFSYEYRKDNIFHSTNFTEFPRIVDTIDRYPESIIFIKDLELYSAQDYSKTHLEHTASKLKMFFRKAYSDNYNGLLSEAKFYNTLPTMNNIQSLKICITNHKTLHKLSTSLPQNLYYLMIDLKLDASADMELNSLKPLTLSISPINIILLKITNKGRKPMIFGAEKSLKTISFLFADIEFNGYEDHEQDEIRYQLHKVGSTNSFFQCGKIIANIISRSYKSMASVQINGISAEMIFLHCETHITYKKLEVISFDWLSVPYLKTWIRIIERHNRALRYFFYRKPMPLIFCIKLPSILNVKTQEKMFHFAGSSSDLWHKISDFNSEYWKRFIEEFSDRFTDTQDAMN